MPAERSESASTSAVAPSSASSGGSAPAVSPSPIGVANRCSTGPLSSPSSICMMLMPVSRSPARMACWIGAAPRKRGSSEAWTLIMPAGRRVEHLAAGGCGRRRPRRRGRARAGGGRRERRSPSGRAGWSTGSPASMRRDLDRRRDQRRAGAALRLVGLGDHAGHREALAEQRPEGRHRELRRPEEDDPHHSVRADSGCDLLGVPGVVLVLPAPAGEQHLPLDQAQVVEEEDAVEVVDLVLDGAGLEPGRPPCGSGCRRGRWPRATTRSGRVTSP